MRTSREWFNYFEYNLTIDRIDWNLRPSLTSAETETILRSLQAWQLGETSDGHNLLRAAFHYAKKTGDSDYVKAIRLFIKEEQKHGHNLGRYLDMAHQHRLKKDWGDTLFRKVRYLNNSMELWTLAVITVESAAQLFYQSLKDATGCELLKQVCTDILIDEVAHIHFQAERLQTIFNDKRPVLKPATAYFYRIFFLCTGALVWWAHRKVFKAGGNTFRTYSRRMKYKFNKVIGPALIRSRNIPFPNTYVAARHGKA